MIELKKDKGINCDMCDEIPQAVVMLDPDGLGNDEHSDIIYICKPCLLKALELLK